MTTLIRNNPSHLVDIVDMDVFAAPPVAPLDMPQQVLETPRAERPLMTSLIRLLVPRQWA